MKNILRHTIPASVMTLCLCVGAVGELQARDILFGATGGARPSDLYILNPANGSILTTVGPIGFPITGLRFDPTSGVLYGSTSNGIPNQSLITINSATGAGTLVGSYGVPGHTMADITFTRDGTLYGWAQPNGGNGLYTINKATGAATLVGPPGISYFRFRSVGELAGRYLSCGRWLRWLRPRFW